jgi:TM2 domain-containing membrane protein YozV
LDAEWYIYADEQSYGPYSGHTLKSFIDAGNLKSNTLVVPLGSQEWKAAREYPVLANLLPKEAVTIAPPPPVNAAAGATVVQVHNVIGQNQPQRPIIVDGMAASKSAGLALFLSFIFCGAGQFYNGQYGKGILMFILCVVTWVVMLGWVISIWSMIDAYSRAKAMNLRYLALISGGNTVLAA